MKLYVCVTYYHVLITMIKGLINDEKYDVLLSNQIPGFEVLLDRLKKSDCFNNIIEFDSNNIRHKGVFINKFIDILTRKARTNHYIRKYCSTDFTIYTDIYFYQDCLELGTYFINNKMKYHLIEDALDYFKYFDDYYGIGMSSYNEDTLKFKIKKITGLGHQAWGTSKYCVDVEVNSLDGLKICNDKFFAVPRKELFESLTAEQKKYVYDVFVGGIEVNNGCDNAVLLCTQPLFAAGHVSTMTIQLRVFESIIRDYHERGFKVVVKPHPRDEADYSTILEKYDCDYIDKNIPSEVLNYNPEIKAYYAAVSITSTSINFLDCAENKVFIGMDYVKQIEAES